VILSSTTGQFAIAPEDLNPNFYTHPLYAFAYIDSKTYKMEYADNELDMFLMSRFTSTLKAGNPCSHPMISVGGATFTSADATRGVWSDMISRRSSRTAFITSAIAKARKFGFAGIDLVCGVPALVMALLLKSRTRRLMCVLSGSSGLGIPR
jgi:GH18 family chitinase